LRGFFLKALSTPSKTLYVIAGPTASGKTAAAIALAQRLGTHIISADSRQCYREMSIGTAKPSLEELATVKHYFIDEFPITRELSAANYEQLALNYLDEIFATHHTAVVCGGTGLYIKALCEGLDAMPPADPTIEEQTEQEYNENGMEWLQQTLSQEDPEFYATGEIQNPARMLRALSFIRTTGKSIIHYRTNTAKQRPFHIIKIGLELPRETLYARINHRVDLMMQQGLEKEVRDLLPHRHLKNLQTVGYAELFDYFDGKCTLNEAVDKIKQHTRNYAKRQLTWFRKDPQMHWFRADDPTLTDKILELK
jgi:tRNA dimethylallyltransferase